MVEISVHTAGESRDSILPGSRASLKVLDPRGSVQNSERVPEQHWATESAALEVEPETGTRVECHASTRAWSWTSTGTWQRSSVPDSARALGLQLDSVSDRLGIGSRAWSRRHCTSTREDSGSNRPRTMEYSFDSRSTAGCSNEPVA